MIRRRRVNESIFDLRKSLADSVCDFVEECERKDYLSILWKDDSLCQMIISDGYCVQLIDYGSSDRVEVYTMSDRSKKFNGNTPKTMEDFSYYIGQDSENMDLEFNIGI